MGDRVPVDTAPSPVPVYKALKNPHSTCKSTATARPSQFLHSEPPGICRCTQRARNNIVHARIRRAATVGSRLSSHRLHPRNLLDMCNRDVEHLVDELQLGKFHGPLISLDHKKTPLRHDKDDDQHDCITGKSIIVSSNWRISVVRRTVWTVGNSLCVKTGCRRPSMNCSCGTTALPDRLHCLDHGPCRSDRNQAKNCPCGVSTYICLDHQTCRCVAHKGR